MANATNSSSGPGTLFVVATPIGHLEDMTFRAVRVLQEVDVIACEDTREAKKLLDRYSITTRTISYHAQSPDSREDQILADLVERSMRIALIADRGTPGVSDPGVRLIQRAIAAGVSVVPIPGASAVLTSLQASGASTQQFVFLGFIPHKKGRQTFVRDALSRPETILFYESPHRILKCLSQLVEEGAGERRVIVARELTKVHEEFLRGTAQEILDILLKRPAVQGEFVVMLDAQQKMSREVLSEMQHPA